jgi:anti-sigma-K factor RskA
VIIEIAHSQKGAILNTLAEEYILGSDLEIRVVVGVDIEYSKNKRATFSVWRAKLQDPDNEVWAVEPTVADRVRLAESTAFLRLTWRRYSDMTMVGRTAKQISG